MAKTDAPPTTPTEAVISIVGGGMTIEGNMDLTIQLLCNDQLESAGAIDLVTANSIDGNPNITFNCTGGFSGPRRIMDWYTRLGS